MRDWNDSPALRYRRMETKLGMTANGAEMRDLLSLAMSEKNGRVSV